MSNNHDLSDIINATSALVQDIASDASANTIIKNRDILNKNTVDMNVNDN